MGEVIVITSGKGGVGKTTTTANIGHGLAKLNKKVLLIDTDIGLRNLDVVMGLENRVVFNLVDLINNRCKKTAAIIKDKKQPNLHLLPAAQNCEKDVITSDQMKTLIRNLKKEYDYILLDCPAGIESGFKNAICAADRAVVVTNPEISSIRDADRIIGLLEANEVHDIKLLVNRLRPEMVKRGDMLSTNDVLEILAIELIGVIPDDEDVVVSTNRGEPCVLNESMAGKAYLNVCKRITGEEVEFLELNKKTFLEKLVSKFKKNSVA